MARWCCSLAAFGFSRFAAATPALTDKDTILLADFVNTTGDPVFDETLKQALAAQLRQSPFLDIFSEDRVHDALKFMEKSPDERVTREIAREICERQGIKAMLIGSICGRRKSLRDFAGSVEREDGRLRSRPNRAEAENKEQVLKALGQAASRLREKLGESLSSIQKYDAPIEQVTTSKLEALRYYSLGLRATFERSLRRRDSVLSSTLSKSISGSRSRTRAWRRATTYTKQYEVGARWPHQRRTNIAIAPANAKSFT